MYAAVVVQIGSGVLRDSGLEHSGFITNAVDTNTIRLRFKFDSSSIRQAFNRRSTRVRRVPLSAIGHKCTLHSDVTLIRYSCSHADLFIYSGRSAEARS